MGDVEVEMRISSTGEKKVKKTKKTKTTKKTTEDGGQQEITVVETTESVEVDGKENQPSITTVTNETYTFFVFLSGNNEPALVACTISPTSAVKFPLSRLYCRRGKGRGTCHSLKSWLQRYTFHSDTRLM